MNNVIHDCSLSSYFPFVGRDNLKPKQTLQNVLKKYVFILGAIRNVFAQVQ